MTTASPSHPTRHAHSPRSAHKPISRSRLRNTLHRAHARARWLAARAAEHVADRVRHTSERDHHQGHHHTGASTALREQWHPAEDPQVKQVEEQERTTLGYEGGLSLVASKSPHVRWTPPTEPRPSHLPLAAIAALTAICMLLADNFLLAFMSEWVRVSLTLFVILVSIITVLND